MIIIEPPESSRMGSDKSSENEEGDTSHREGPIVQQYNCGLSKSSKRSSRYGNDESSDPHFSSDEEEEEEKKASSKE